MTVPLGLAVLPTAWRRVPECRDLQMKNPVDWRGAGDSRTRRYRLRSDIGGFCLVAYLAAGLAAASALAAWLLIAGKVPSRLMLESQG